MRCKWRYQVGQKPHRVHGGQQNGFRFIATRTVFEEHRAAVARVHRNKLARVGNQFSHIQRTLVGQQLIQIILADFESALDFWAQLLSFGAFDLCIIFRFKWFHKHFLLITTTKWVKCAPSTRLNDLFFTIAPIVARFFVQLCKYFFVNLLRLG